jgi:hypothetical protein
MFVISILAGFLLWEEKEEEVQVHQGSSLFILVNIS